MSPPKSGTLSPRPRRHAPGWVRIFVIGSALWLATVLITFATENANLVPTLILLGSFLVPVTFAAFALERADEVLTPQHVLTAFVYGGVTGVLGASLLESVFLRHPSGLTYLGVGLIEEGVKLAALWLLARTVLRYTMRDGLALGAAVGFGFAAFESAGYAFNALFTRDGLSLLDAVESEVLRGILAPVGHGLWTAILGGALFATAARGGRPRPSTALLGWFVVVVLLHAFWDASPSIAQWLTPLLTASPSQAPLRFGAGPGALTSAQLRLATMLSWALFALDALVGLLILRARQRRAAVPAVTGPTRSAMT
ncbi:PrsW family glutamic-type intramembrane protease [Actinomadura sp. NPDC049753]|uniref:PrsW family intramembrane metalloprotease n=1 Tax=Actinomadura sp. NPDC049753 TaxID=3154739 RepID=UPI0034433B20